jgi:shikimate dehydrogenase
VIVAARRIARADALVSDFRAGPLASNRTELIALPLDVSDPRLGAAVASSDLLVNATPVGMGHAAAPAPPISLDGLPPRTLVYDLIYRPPLTPLLREARERGAAVLNGLPMLIYQGAASFERWTGQPAPVGLMRRAAEEALRE